MRALIASEFITLDNVIEDPGGAENFTYGGWTWPYHSEEIANFKLEELYEADAILLGRSTYQSFAKAWTAKTDKDGYADRINSLPKYVVSSRLKEAKWQNSQIINIADVASLKSQRGKSILVFGSAKLVQSLCELKLVDEIKLLIYPVILGNGKLLFKKTRLDLKLIEMRTYHTGVVYLKYGTLE